MAQLIPAELTVKETDFMIRHFGLQPGNKVLDIMCGYGRHAIALAEKGISVTAVDNLSEYIDEITETARNKNLPIRAIKADVIHYEPNDIFDLAICMGNSICFFDRDDTVKLLKMISSHLSSWWATFDKYLDAGGDRFQWFPGKIMGLCRRHEIHY